MRAAISAASSTGWTPITVSPETGYLLAERGVTVMGADHDGSYRLEVTIPPSGGGQVVAKVTPPPGVMGGLSPETLVVAFLDAFEQALGT